MLQDLFEKKNYKRFQEENTKNHSNKIFLRVELGEKIYNFFTSDQQNKNIYIFKRRKKKCIRQKRFKND